MNQDRDDALELVGFQPIVGLVQVLMAVWVPGKGYLITKRSIIYGGRHGDPPLIMDQASWPIVESEVRGGLRTLAHRYEEETREV